MTRTRFLRSIALSIAVGCTVAAGTAHADPFAITRSVGARTCGYVKNGKKPAAWQLGTVVNGSFLTHDEYASLLKKLAKKVRRRADKNAFNNLASYLKSDLKQSGALCRSLPPPSFAVGSLPRIDRIVSSGASNVSVAQVQGTPPAFTDISTIGAESLFWRPGVIDEILSGAPSPNACTEFSGIGADGSSAGDAGCMMTQRVGLGFRSIIEGAENLCVLKNGLTEDNLASGGVSLVSGDLSGAGGVANLLNAPAAAGRLVAVDQVNTGAGDRTQFVRVASVTENVAAGRLFQAEMWQCRDGQPQRAETIAIDSNGLFVNLIRQKNTFENLTQVVIGSLQQLADSSYRFDSARARSARIVAGSSTFFSTWDIGLDASNRMSMRSFSGFTSGAGTERSVTIADLQGSNVSQMRLLQVAHRQLLLSDGLPVSPAVASMEYRDTGYFSAPSSQLAAIAAGTSFSDPFYTTVPASTVDLSSYSCALTPEIRLQLDLAHDGIRNSTAQCTDTELEDYNFCGTERLMMARTGRFVLCTQ